MLLHHRQPTKGEEEEKEEGEEGDYCGSFRRCRFRKRGLVFEGRGIEWFVTARRRGAFLVDRR